MAEDRQKGSLASCSTATSVKPPDFCHC